MTFIDALSTYEYHSDKVIGLTYKGMNFKFSPIMQKLNQGNFLVDDEGNNLHLSTKEYFSLEWNLIFKEGI